MSKSHQQVHVSPALLFPLDGDMLNEYDGVWRDERLHIRVRLAGPAGSRFTVNGISAKRADGEYTAEIKLDGYRNTIAVAEEETGYNETVTVYWLKNATMKYRVSVDDNIWFLRDIAANSETYRSIFDNPYLSVYKELYDTYGTKVHLNLFYRTDGFDLSQMPDKYKEEWQANAHWLRLTFHADQEFPDKPYKATAPEVILADCEQVTREIIRFAGEESLSHVTTVHWGEATREGSRALRKFGFRTLAGYFRLIDGEPIVSYYLDKDRVEHLNKRDFWKDHSEDLVFAKIDMVLDKTEKEDIVPMLEQIRQNPHEAGFIELMIHEQYFYSDYAAHQPDFKEKLMTAAKWATENGYKPAFLSECVEE
ncbi:hypothetical protein [Paenibacillus sp. MBLB4367]|uniref:hypothetical protein n=1 Tax=Paenibacillus sp. MBLB4367 TaxID=3384767 RepID=UPI0039083FC8